jgi:hypothetical protein
MSLSQLDHRLGGETPQSGWPLLGISFVLLRTNIELDERDGGSCKSVKETVRFWAWALSDATARFIAKDHGMAPLPEGAASTVVREMLKTVSPLRRTRDHLIIVATRDSTECLLAV